MALFLGLAAFGLGYLSGGDYSPVAASGLLIGAIVVSLGLGLLLRLPLLKQVVSGLRQMVAWSALQWLGIPLYAGVMGIGLAQRGETEIGVWVALMASGILALILLAAATRPAWERWTPTLTTWQSVLSGLVLLGLVLFLLAVSIQASTSVVRLLLLVQVLLIGSLFFLGGFQVAADRRPGHPMTRIACVLFPCMGLVAVAGLL